MAQFPMLLTAISTFGYAEIIPVSDAQEDGVLGRHLTGAYVGSAWEGGRLSYTFKKNVPQKHRDEIKKQLDVLTDEVGGRGCLKFDEVDPTFEGPYVTFITTGAEGCSSLVGKTESADKHAHDIHLEWPGCSWPGTIKHEMMHALGFIHTHQRPDRDDHLDVAWENMHEDEHPQFTKEDPREIETYGIPYDAQSIMHYKDTSFQEEDGKTMVSANGTKLKTRATQYLTHSDVKFVQKFYQCIETGAGSIDGGVSVHEGGEEGAGAPKIIVGGRLADSSASDGTSTSSSASDGTTKNGVPCIAYKGIPAVCGYHGYGSTWCYTSRSSDGWDHCDTQSGASPATKTTTQKPATPKPDNTWGNGRLRSR